MQDIYTRTQMLIGSDIEKLKDAKVLLCGLGGVGGYTLEAIVRAGIGAINVMDNDVFSPSNLNRQILATLKSVGAKKTDVALKRIRSINPLCKAKAYDMFYLPDNADSLPLDGYDYIIDCIDTVSAKLELIKRAKALDIPIISCMGTGNKLGVKFEVADIYSTSVCPLARVMRKSLKDMNIPSLKVVYSKEKPIEIDSVYENGRHIPASISYAPAIAGLVLASEVIKDIIAR